MSGEGIYENGAAAPESAVRSVRMVGSCDMYSELASGGTASVSIGLHRGAEGFEKVVAIKRLLPAFAADANYQAMLADEADVSARAGHPFVRDVFDLGVGDDGTPFVVMEFLFGQPLIALHRAMSAAPAIARDARHTAIVARIVANLCEGLHAVHELEDGSAPLEVVHRDVTPHNLFVLYDGTVRVTDFGIVRARVRRQAPSGTMLKGKLAYMSPEYLSRRPYDRRSDVWSMGVVLWELVTGVRLFRKESDPESVYAITEGSILPPSVVTGEVDRQFDAIVLKALNRDVEQRYRTARDLSNDLEQWLHHERRAPNAADIGAWIEALLPGARTDLHRVVNEARAGRAKPRSTSSRPTLHPTAHSRPTAAVGSSRMRGGS